MSKHCISEIDGNYELIYTIDAKNKKTGIILNVGALILTIVIIFLGMFFISLNNEINFSLDSISYLYLLLFFLSMVLYLVAHELTHGVVYKIFTKEKLKFGISFSCAYCGVPNVYVDRKTAMWAVITPFIFYSICFLLPIFLLESVGLEVFFLLLFAFHFGGCIGDLYVYFLYIISFKGNVYMKDIGAKQEFYLKRG